MHKLTRRTFVQTAMHGSIVGTLFLHRFAHGADKRNRQMTICLSAGRIGVRVSLGGAIELAAQYGFESIDPNANDLAQLSEAERNQLQDAMSAKQIVFGAAGLSVDFRNSEAKFAAGLSKLPQLALGLQRAGVTRIGTWIRPSHDELTYRQNFERHVKRLRPLARVLADHGLRFGLEYVGPKTSWSNQQFPFIHTMAEMKELITEMDCDNVGLVLDSWHWYTAGETAADLLTLTNADVVAVDLNDAPANIPREEQVDSKRELPCATGVIDVGTFLTCLNRIGYDGPVRAEPFNTALRAMSKSDAVAATAKAMKQAFGLIALRTSSS